MSGMTCQPTKPPFPSDEDFSQPLKKRLRSREMKPREATHQMNFPLLSDIPIRRKNPGLNCYGIVQRHDAGTFDVLCAHCSSLNFKDESVAGHFSKCCHDGKVTLPSIKLDPVVEALFVENTPQARNFKQYARNYNNAFALASVVTKTTTFTGHGPQPFKVQGQIQHLLYCLEQTDGVEPSFAQLYILDPTEANNFRSNHKANEACRQDVVEIISECLHRVNPFIRNIKQMQEIEAEEGQRAKHENRSPRELILKMQTDKQKDQRRYNHPRDTGGLALVFESDQDGAVPNRTLAVIRKQGSPQYLSHLDPLADPLCYTLFFNHGEYGWDPSLQQNTVSRKTKNTKVTQLMFHAYRLARRQEFSPLHSAGKLSEQYFVDVYARVEAERLLYIRLNQDKLRRDDYVGLSDFARQRSEETGLRAGRIFVLPSTFQGSQRALQQNFQDAMAIVQELGRATFFETFTCNPKWHEVESAFATLKTSFKSDVECRVFQLKLKAFIEDHVKRKCFGEVEGYVYTIEFQKRGLPHAHILFIMADKHAFRTAAQIDAVVSAEIPDPETDPILHAIVTKHMIHGPCGKDYPHAPCMKDGKCSKNFPRDFTETTLENSNGYPLYRRRDNQRTIQKGGAILDNRHVVPYNRYLLYRYDSHINTEICVSVKSVKYI